MKEGFRPLYQLQNESERVEVDNGTFETNEMVEYLRDFEEGEAMMDVGAKISLVLLGILLLLLASLACVAVRSRDPNAKYDLLGEEDNNEERGAKSRVSKVNGRGGRGRRVRAASEGEVEGLVSR